MTTTMSPARRFPRGSEWRRWDLHVHTPESVLNNQFGDDWDTYVYRLFKAAIAHKISVIGITDYFSIEGYKKLNVEYLGQPERLKVMFCDELRADPNYLEKIGSILVLPNIEFRIDKFVQTKSEEGLSRLTMHVIFSDDVSIHDIEQNFLGNLKFSFRGVPQSKNEKRSLNIVNLEELGARLRGEQASFQKKSNLFVGCMTATVDDDEISDALCAAPSLFGNRHVLVLAEEYLSQVAWGGSGHQARKVLYQKCDVVFSSNEKTIALLASPSFAKEFGRQKACLWGSDAHSFDELFVSAKSRYCWIKSDVAFSGLRQVLNEPVSRCYIGENPPQLLALQYNKRPYISGLTYAKRPESSLSEKWFDGLSLAFNPGMVAIIGNKGSGKSALADTLALLGASHVDIEHFSFLKPARFKRKYNGGKTDRAQEFKATLRWGSGEEVSRSLAEVTSSDELERVRYLPQGYLETLCNENDETAQKAFRDELERVIFSHVKLSNRLGKSSLSELIDHSGDEIRRTKSNLKRHIRDINHQIIALEQKISVSAVSALDEKIRSKQADLSRVEDSKPTEVADPRLDGSLRLSGESVLKEIEQHKSKFAAIGEQLAAATKDLAGLRIRIGRAEKVRERLNKARGYFELVLPEVTRELKDLDIDDRGVLEVNVRTESVDSFLTGTRLEAEKLEERLDPAHPTSMVRYHEAEGKTVEKLRANLDIPQRLYQAHLADLAEWEQRKKDLLGEIGLPDTIAFLLHLRSEVQEVYPAKLSKLKEARRDSLFKVYRETLRQADVFRVHYEPVLKFIERERDALESFPVSFDVVFDGSMFLERFFTQVSQAVVGTFCGISEGQKKLKEMMPQGVFDTEESTVGFVVAVMEALTCDLREGAGRANSVEKQLRKSTTVEELYNFLFCLEYLEPRYVLRVGGKSLQELSPGERGLLLLIFYLLIDKDNGPLIIDQPEENLDNQSIKNVLVPCMRAAKERRQLFVVTHNPNVAVVCDAEQVIYTSIDKVGDHAIVYESGSIEDGVMNRCVVDVLEGTPSAFENRSNKYRTGGSL